jgi:hypothetical protein
MFESNDIFCPDRELIVCLANLDRRQGAGDKEKQEVPLERSRFDFEKWKRYSPFLYHLQKVEWHVFGTLTWKDESRRGDNAQAQRNRREDFNWLLMNTAKAFKKRLKQFKVYRCNEFGAAGECHYHYLIARNGLESISAEKISNLMNYYWNSYLSPFDRLNQLGIGHAVVMPFEQAMHSRGVCYCCKIEFDEIGRQRERDDYLSEGLMKLIKSIPNNENLRDEEFALN